MRLATLATLAALWLAPVLAGQEDLGNVRVNDREQLHPSLNPTVIVGIEQEDNSFRDRTPALYQSDRQPELLDPEENYRRRLAMYTEGASFHRPPSRADGPAGPGPADDEATTTPAARAESSDPSLLRWAWLIPLFAVGLFAVGVGLQRLGVLDKGLRLHL
ncbi:MAG: hypothetical protein AAF682_03820 [Planctomycetota bacterium]